MSRLGNSLTLLVLLCSAFGLGTTATSAQDTAPGETLTNAIPIAPLTRDSPIDFQTEILPFLKSNCLACHNQTKAKAGLILETPQTIQKGGDNGPSAIPKRSDDSLILQAAAHRGETPMPPRGNKVNAVNLTPEQLALLKLWIDQGAQGEVRTATPIIWKPLPQEFNPVFSVALTEDGQYAACGRGNRISVYHLPSGQLAAQLADPEFGSSDSRASKDAAHYDTVNSLAFSPDSNLLASGGYREIKLWRRSPGKPSLKLPPGRLGASRLLAISPSGEWLALADGDQKLHVYHLPFGQPLEIGLSRPGTLRALQFSKDGRHLAAVGENGALSVWIVSDQNLSAQGNVHKPVHSLTWLADDTLFATASDTTIIDLWQLPKEPNTPLTKVREIDNRAAIAGSLTSTSIHSEELIVPSTDGMLRVWNVLTGELIRESKLGESIANVAVRSDGYRSVWIDKSGVAKLGDARTGEFITTLRGDRHASELVAKHVRLKTFTSSEVDFRKSDLARIQKELKTEQDRLQKATEALAEAKKTLAEKQTAFAAATNHQTAIEKELTDLEAMFEKITAEYTAAEKAMTEARTEAAAIVEQVAAARTRVEPAEDTQSSAKALATETAKLLADTALQKLAANSFAAGKLKPEFDRITAMTPEKRKTLNDQLEAAKKAVPNAQKELEKSQLTLSGAENDAALTKKNFETFTLDVVTAEADLAEAETNRSNAEAALAAANKTAELAQAPVLDAAFSPDNLTIATTDGQSARTWNADTGEPIETFSANGQTIVSIIFTADHHLIAQTENEGAIVWNIQPEWTLERRLGASDQTSPIVDRVNALAFSPGGETLASGGGEPSRSGEIQIWRTSDGSLLNNFDRVHSDAVLALDFSSDGRFLASGASDRFIRIIDPETGVVLKSLEGHTHHVLGVSWKYDGRTLASAGADNVVKIWNAVTGERKKSIDGFTKEVTAVHFIGITDQAIVCTGDATVRIIKENGEKGREFEGATDFLYAVASTPDAARVVAGGQDGSLRVWNGRNGTVLKTFSPSDAEAKLAGSVAP